MPRMTKRQRRDMRRRAQGFLENKNCVLRWFNLLHDTEIGNWSEGVPSLLTIFFFSVYGPACRYNFRKANLELLCNCLLGTSGTYSSVELECAFRQMGLLQRIYAHYPDHVSVLRGSRLAGAMRKVLA